MINTIDVLKKSSITVQEPRLEKLIEWLDQSFVLDTDIAIEAVYAEGYHYAFEYRDGTPCTPKTLIGVDMSGETVLMPDIIVVNFPNNAPTSGDYAGKPINCS